MAEQRISLRVVSPSKTVFDGEVQSLVLPGWDGEVGLLPGHAPYMTLLGTGVLRAAKVDGGTETFYLSRGIAKMEANRVTVLSEYAGTEPSPDFEQKKGWLDREELTG